MEQNFSQNMAYESAMLSVQVLENLLFFLIQSKTMVKRDIKLMENNP